MGNSRLATFPLGIILFAVFAAAAPMASAQNPDFDFAEKLGRYEYYDLAEHVFKKISESATYQEKDRAAGRYGLAKLAKIQAETERLIDNKIKLIDKAIASINDYLRVAKGSELEGQAKNDIADLYTTKGRVMARKAEVEAKPEFFAEAEKAYDAATRRYEDAVNQMKAQEAKMREGKGNPEWEYNFKMAQYNYAVALFNHATLYTGIKEKAEQMKSLLKKVEAICEDFMWKYDGHLVTFDLGTYRGRANAMLAETAPTEVEREEYFKKALGGMSFQLSTDTLAGKLKDDPTLKSPSNPMHAAVKEIIAKGYLHKMKAYISYGDIKKKAGSHYYQMAIDDGAKAFGYYPDSLNDDVFLQILLEQGKAYCKLDMVDKATKILKPLTSIADNRNPLASAAKELLVKHGGTIPLKQRMDSAEQFYQQGEVDKALDEFLRLTGELNTPEMQQQMPRIMYRIADSYLSMGRYFEAMAAFAIFDTPEGQQHEDFAAAANKRFKLANRIKSITKDPADEAEYKRLQKLMVERGLATGSVLYDRGFDFFEKKDYKNAFDMFAKVDAKDAEYEESIFMAGFCQYKMGRDLISLEAKEKKEEGINHLIAARSCFGIHLNTVMGLVKDKKGIDPDLKRRWETSILSMTTLYMDGHPRLNDPKKAMAYAEVMNSVPNPSGERMPSILSLRVRGRLFLDEFDKAEEALKTLEEKYAHKRDLISDARFNIASSLDEKAKKLEKTDPAKFKEVQKKANEALATWIKSADRTKIKASNFRVIGDRLFAYAEETKNSDHYKDALEMYQEYDIYMKAPEKNGLKPLTKEEAENYQKILAKCCLRTGNFATAYKIYTMDLKAADNDAPLYLQIEFAELCRSRAESEPDPSSDRAEYFRKSRDIYGKLSARINRFISDEAAMEKKSAAERDDLWQRFWEYLHEYCLITFNLKEYEKVDDLLKQYGGLYPGYDKGKWGYQAKFEELEKKVKAALQLEKEKKQ